MTIPYFRYVPNFEYVNRLRENRTITQYIQVKNLFKRGVIREDIFTDLTNFTKYSIVGDERPDNIANKVYGSQYYDWVVLLSNNVINYQNEWPMSQQSFQNYLDTKYITEQNLYSTHHYETKEVKDSYGFILVPAGLVVDKNFSYTFYDGGLGTEITKTNITTEVTNYDYEVKKEDEKRNIYLLKKEYLSIITRNIKSSLLYKEGSSQYVNKNLVKGENIRLFQP
jgi:hypothetical protein